MVNKSAMNASWITTADDYTTPLMANLGFACALLLFVIAVVGFCGNTVSLYVFTRPHFRATSINVLLAALAVTDNLLLGLAVPVFATDPLCVWLRYQCPYNILISIAVTIYAPTVMAQCCSIWLLVLITIERWVAVCRPFYAYAYLTRGRSLLSVVFVVALSVSHNIVRFWEFQKSHVNGTDVVEIIANLRNNPGYMLWYQNVLCSITMFLIPLTCLALFTYDVAKKISLSRRQRQRLSISECMEHKTAQMMQNIVLVFVCCYGVSFVLNVIEMTYNRFANSSVGHLLNNFNNVLVSTNSACNCIFYWKYCSRFRNEVKLLHPARLLHLARSRTLGSNLEQLNQSRFTANAESGRTNESGLLSESFMSSRHPPTMQYSRLLHEFTELQLMRSTTDIESEATNQQRSSIVSLTNSDDVVNGNAMALSDVGGCQLQVASVHDLCLSCQSSMETVYKSVAST